MLQVEERRINHFYYLYHKKREFKLLGPIDDIEIYSEFDIFPGGLPDIEDIKVKKRKTDDDKFLFEEGKNPAPTPTCFESSQSNKLSDFN